MDDATRCKPPSTHKVHKVIVNSGTLCSTLSSLHDTTLPSIDDTQLTSKPGLATSGTPICSLGYSHMDIPNYESQSDIEIAHLVSVRVYEN